ncbi:hypothetical protein Q1695_009631 [Nippostrongylus brasiliensis]|nr:hypothetical protein Q1695_009631 [Nippostrongylus brasiliensis]
MVPAFADIYRRFERRFQTPCENSTHVFPNFPSTSTAKTGVWCFSTAHCCANMIAFGILVIVLLTFRTVTSSISLPLSDEEIQCLDDIGMMGVNYFAFAFCVTSAAHNKVKCKDCAKRYLNPNIRQCLVKKAFVCLKAYC